MDHVQWHFKLANFFQINAYNHSFGGHSNHFLLLNINLYDSVSRNAIRLLTFRYNMRSHLVPQNTTQRERLTFEDGIIHAFTPLLCEIPMEICYCIVKTFQGFICI